MLSTTAKACVLGEYDLVSALGRAGIPCAVAAVKGDPATYSRHARETLRWIDPWDRSDEMVEELIAWARGQAEQPVLFYNGDHDLLLVSRHRQELKPWFRFVVPDADLIEALVDKERFAELARATGLPVPPSATFEAHTADPGDVDLGFPMVVKPLRRRHSTWNPASGGSKAIRVEDIAGLHELWPRLGDQGRLIAQRLVRGDESRIESFHAYVREGGRLACAFTGRKIRTLPREFGDTTALEITDERDVHELGREIIGKLELTGVAKLDFKRDEDGKLWLLEINPRFNLWHNAAAAAGANIPALVYGDLLGGAPMRCDATPGVTWCHPTKDFRAARAEGMSLRTWLRFARSCEARWAFSMKDPMPFMRGVVIRRLAARSPRR